MDVLKFKNEVHLPVCLSVCLSVQISAGLYYRMKYSHLYDHELEGKVILIHMNYFLKLRKKQTKR